MKFSEGTLKRVFEQVAPDYPEIESWHVIVDNCAHQLVKRPEQFEVIVTTNMNGDILSDLSSALIGGLGFAPSANIGNEVAIFEAVHGSAPKYAGKNVINPTAVILSSVMMLRYLGLFEEAASIEHAVFVTLESGVLTGDVPRLRPGHAHHRVHRDDHRQPGEAHRDLDDPRTAAAAAAGALHRPRLREGLLARGGGTRRLRGVAAGRRGAGRLADGAHARTRGSSLRMISSRGTKVYPPTGAITDTVDHWRCRFIVKENPGDLPDEDVNQLLARISRRHRWMHIEKLLEFDGELGFTRDQGEN